MNLSAALDLFCQRKLESRLVFQGLNISVENDKGSIRRGVAPDHKKWQTKMTVPYGYIRKTQGVDGDHVDCFVGPFAGAKNAYVVHTKRPPDFKRFDEDKVMLGFKNPKEAKRVFLENYDRPEFFGSMDTLSMKDFKRKVLATKDHPMKIAAEFPLGEPGGPPATAAHIEPHAPFHPPSLRHPKHVPVDNPGEKDDSVGDVKKRKAAETERWRTELIRRQPRPPGTVPVRTTAQEPTQGISPMF